MFLFKCFDGVLILCRSFKKIIRASRTISVKKIPEPIISFEGENKGFVQFSELSSLGKLLLTYPEKFSVHLRSKVSSFHLIMRDPSGIGTFSSMMRNEKIDDTMLSFLKTIKKGSAVIINNIRVLSPQSGQIRINVTKEIIIH